MYLALNSKFVITKNKYFEDKSFHLNVKIFIALAFDPVLDVVKVFDLIAEKFDDNA